MNNTFKHILITVSVCLVLIIGVGVGIFFVSKDVVDGKKKNETVEQVPLQEGTRATKPESIIGVCFSENDYPDFSDMTSQDVKDFVDKTVSNISEKGFNTVFLDIFESQKNTVCKDGKVDFTELFIKKLKDKDIFACAVCDLERNEDVKSIENIIEEYELSCITLKNGTAVIDISKNMKDNHKDVILSYFVTKDNVDEILENSTFGDEDFLINIPLNIGDSVKNYVKNVTYVDKSAAKKGIDVVAGIRLDLIEKELKSDRKISSVIIEQLALNEQLESFTGSAVFDYSNIFNSSAASETILKYFCDKQNAQNNKDFELKNFMGTKKTTDESKFTFTGSSSPLYDLTLNSEKVDRESNGDFSFEVKLKKGANTFKFEHKDKVYTYTVVYTSDIIKSVTPTGTINVPGKSMITIKAVILKGSSAYATLGGDTISMKKVSDVLPSESGFKLDESSDFAVYVGNYTVPAGKISSQALGRIKVYANYNGMSASLSGARVSVSAEIPTPKPPEPGDSGGSEVKPGGNTTPFDPSVMLTPYKYAGVSGKSKMCEIVSLCETMPANVVDDYVPYSSPLPSGTFDYVTSEYVFGGKKYLKLASGKNILEEKAKIIPSGYNLPKNRIDVVESKSDSDATTIKFGLLWKAPFNVAVKNQSYIPQSQANGGSLHSIKSFNAKYIDITFYHAANVTGKVNIQGSRIISSAQWTSNPKSSTINLRLNFKSPGKFYGYSIRYTGDGCLTLSVKAKPSSSLSSSVIMIDPGHGGMDSGAVCAYSPSSGKQYEKQLNLLIANKIKAKLEARGAAVIMTRVSDNAYISLEDRQALVRSKNPDMFISVHCDSSDSAKPMGTTAFYYQAYSYPLAQSVHNRIVSAFKNSVYEGLSPSVINKIDRGTNMYPFKVTRVEECPAILVEYGFVSNINECKKLWMNSTQEKLAQATVDGIADYISNN